MNQCPPSPRVSHQDRFEFFRKFAEIHIRNLRCTTGINDTGSKFCHHAVLQVLLTTVANLPPVSLIPVVHLNLRISPRIFEKISKKHRRQILPPCSFASVVDNGGKFATGVNATGGNLPTVSTSPAANLPPVPMTPVANNWNNIRLLRP
jgi:hypothetical protein